MLARKARSWGVQSKPAAAGLDGQTNMYLGWMGLFYANSVGKKDVVVLKELTLAMDKVGGR